MSALPMMSKAKSRMLLAHVFFASILLSTKVVEDKSCPTAWTDMVQIGYNPDFIASLNDPEVILFVLAHEVLHIVLKHGFRLRGRNPKVWNIACDHAINLMLKAAGFKLWVNCYHDDRFKGMSAEAIYDLLMREPEQGAGGGNGRQDGGMPGDLHEPGNLDPEQQAVIERRIDQMVAQAASMARMAGKLSGDLAKLVDGILNPPLPWQQLLREYATQGLRLDETWSRRDRRHPDIYLPGKEGQTMGEVVIIGDASGSTTAQMFAQIGAEMVEIIEAVQPERLRVIWADDDECVLEEVFEAGDLIELHPKGGGGTDMRKPCLYVEKFEPIVVILVTDGYTPWPTEEPPYPLIVCCSTDAEVPIGRVVRLTP